MVIGLFRLVLGLCLVILPVIVVGYVYCLLGLFGYWLLDYFRFVLFGLCIGVIVTALFDLLLAL